MGIVVGIDLGTTFSAVARLDETGRPVIVHNSDGSNITPSVIAVSGRENFEVGEGPRKELGSQNVFGRFKREMGTQTKYVSEWGEFTPTELSAILLKKLKLEAENATRDNIIEAVVTIPANFSNEAREATLSAARNAGLEVKHIINEPTAAAMYFAQSQSVELGGVYAVFDLGGGTFDVTIIRVDGKDIEVLATEGVSKLGGDDFDTKVREIVARKYSQAVGGEIGENDFSPNEVEELKKSLSRRDTGRTKTYGSAGRTDVEMQRLEFEEAISTYISQMEMLCESAMTEAKISKAEIQAVILAGGSTRIPAVQKSVERVFGIKPTTFGNPDEIVALGAAVYAAYRTDQSNLNPIQRSAVSSIKVSEITSKYFGTMSVGFNESRNSEELQNTIVIQKGDRIPTSVTESFFTRHDDQRFVHCTVTEANSPETDRRFVRMIWEGELGPLPEGRAAGQQVDVTFAYDSNQVMQCTFTDVESGQSEEVDLSMATASEADDFDIEKFTVG